MVSEKKIILKETFKSNTSEKVVDWLASRTNLSKLKIKKTIEHGGLWIRSGKKLSRVRRNSMQLKNGDKIEFYYDPNISTALYDQVKCLYKEKDFAVWFKPAGMLSQESKYSEIGSMVHCLKEMGKKPFILQRLDRETAGVMIVAYTKQMATYFTESLHTNKIQKYYKAIVLGQFSEDGPDTRERVIDLSLDGKSALTIYKIIQTKNFQTMVDIEIKTGRYHQIRQHFDLIDHPVIGDPQYGRNNKNSSGMKLIAYKISFIHPFSGKKIETGIEGNLDFD